MAINLQVDSDSVKRTSSRVPGGSVDQPVLYDVPFDVPPEPGVAFEEQAVHDLGQFESFGSRAAEVLAPLVPDPLLGDVLAAGGGPVSCYRQAGVGACRSRGTS